MKDRVFSDGILLHPGPKAHADGWLLKCYKLSRPL
jgi:hypothetical protein